MVAEGARNLAFAVILRAARDLAGCRTPPHHRATARAFLEEAARSEGWGAAVFALAGLGAGDAAYLLARAEARERIRQAS